MDDAQRFRNHRAIHGDVDGCRGCELGRQHDEGPVESEPVLNAEELPWPPGSVGD